MFLVLHKSKRISQLLFSINSSENPGLPDFNSNRSRLICLNLFNIRSKILRQYLTKNIEMPVQTHKNNISNSLCFDACNVYAIYAEHTGLKTQKFQFS